MNNEMHNNTIKPPQKSVWLIVIVRGLPISRLGRFAPSNKRMLLIRSAVS